MDKTILEYAGIIQSVVMKLQRRLSMKITSALAEGNISLPQYTALLVLTEKGRATMSEIAEGLGVTTAAVTGIIDKLVSEGLVLRERCIEDRRVVRAETTDKGRKVIEDVKEGMVQTIAGIMEKLSESDRKKWIELYQKIEQTTLQP